MKTDSGYEVAEVDEQTTRKMKENWEGFAKFGITKVIPGDFYASEQFPMKIDTIHHFTLRPRDLFVCSYLKVGSTFLTEIVYAIVNNADLDNPRQNEDAHSKSPWLETEVFLPIDEIPMVMGKSLQPGDTFIDMLNRLPDTRVFHTHLLFDMLPKGTMDKAKCVYVIRDPRDVCLSYYHYVRNVTFLGYVKSLETFVDDFVDGKMFWGNYIDHIRQWWTHRNNPNVYTVYYEDFKRNPKIEIKKLGGFLGLQLTERQIQNIIHYTSMEEMKKRCILTTNETAIKEFVKSSDVPTFYRKGEVGSSKTDMTAEMNEKISKYYRENLGEIKLPYDFTN